MRSTNGRRPRSNAPKDERPKMRPGFGRLGLIAVLLAVGGCVNSSEPQFEADPTYQEMVGKLRDSAAASAETRRQQDLDSVRQLTIVRASGGKGYLVSADLKGASVDLVVNRILTVTKQPYNLSNVRLGGRATVRFSRLPLVEALNLVLAASSLSVADVDGNLVFRNGSSIQAAAYRAADGGEDDRPVTESIALKNISSEEAISLLEGLYPAGSDQPNAIAVSYGALPDLNEVYVAGARNDVSDAVAVLNRADREVPHVLIEALVVEFDTTATAALGADIADAATGVFSGIALSPGAEAANIAFSFEQGAVNTNQLMAMIDFLVSHQKAQILSRPYLSVRSGQEANVEIVNDQYVAVGATSDGVNITSQGDITAGVRLEITPTVQADDIVRIEMTVEDLSFEPVGGNNILTERERKTARTSVSVPDGRAVVIGGLNQRRLTSSNAGIPWLRGVPVLNLLTAKQAGEDRTKEVVVYLVPRIWDPNGSPPPPNDFHVDTNPKTRYERLKH